MLLDDIGSTGQTLLAATHALRKCGMTQPLCIVVHALFEKLTQEYLAPRQRVSGRVSIPRRD